MAPVSGEGTRTARWRWWHAAAFGLAVNAVSGLSVGNRKEDRAFYHAMKLPRYAPPGWLFPPAWAINNAFTLWGNLRMLNQPAGTPGRRPMMALQAASWALFSTFSFVYFRKRSPVLAAVWTAADWVLTALTVGIAAKHGQGDIAKSQVTKFAWLTLAVPVSSYQALHNPDPLFGTQPAAADAGDDTESGVPSGRWPDGDAPSREDQPQPHTWVRA
jgi:tryptophan-rich sensory protein